MVSAKKGKATTATRAMATAVLGRSERNLGTLGPRNDHSPSILFYFQWGGDPDDIQWRMKTPFDL
jgi:hypothetical protein